MKDKVKVIFKNLHDFSEIEASNLRIEYGGQSIEFRDGKIRVEPTEEPEEPASFCETWNDCKKLVSIQQSGEIDGEIIRIGGSKEVVHITLSINGKETSGINAKRKIAKDMGKYLFEQVRLFGNGRWERDDDGIWNLSSFNVDRFEVLDESSLSQTILDLRELKGEWKEDALSEILESRHS